MPFSLGTVDRRVLRRAVLSASVVVALLLVAYLVPIPGIDQVRTWGESLGAWFPWAFFTAYLLITAFLPIPRTAFTTMSGVFFGPLVGFTGAMIAASGAAVLAFVVVRALGRERVQPYMKKAVLATIDARLRRRGWLAVGSLRFIPVCPFWILNCASALSSVRLLPYFVATVVCMAPGTAAVVLLGDALTGESNPALLAVSACSFALGIIGLVIDARTPLSPRSRDRS